MWLGLIRVAGNVLAGVGAWHVLDFFKPNSETKKEGFFNLERVLFFIGLAFLIINLWKRYKRRF